MLEARYTNDRIRKWCEDPEDEVNWAVHVFLGVNRDLSREPSALVMLLDQPVTIAGRKITSLEMQLYGHDSSTAPPGKGVIKVELVSSYSFWKRLSTDQYLEEKERVADQVIAILENHFTGIREQIEAVDVPTLLTWERFMGGTQGLNNMPKRKFNIVGSMSASGMKTKLPGLADFYFTGVWPTMAGALFINALSGKMVLEEICRRDGKSFRSHPPAT